MPKPCNNCNSRPKVVTRLVTPVNFDNQEKVVEVEPAFTFIPDAESVGTPEELRRSLVGKTIRLRFRQP